MQKGVESLWGLQFSEWRLPVVLPGMSCASNVLPVSAQCLDNFLVSEGGVWQDGVGKAFVLLGCFVLLVLLIVLF